LLIFNEILDKGFDPQNFLGGLSSHLRDLLVSLDNSTIKLLEVSEGLKSRYLEQSSRCNPEFIYQALEICNQADLQYRTSHNQRLLIELCLVKLANLQDLKKKSREQQLVEPEHEKTLEISEKQDVTHKVTQSATVINSDAPVRDSIPRKNTHIEIDTRTTVEEKKNVIKTTGISIKNLMSTPATPEKSEPASGDDSADLSEEPVADIEELKENVFNQEELEKYWNLFASIIRQDRPRISSTISSRMPGLMNDYKIDVLMENINQLEDFNLSIKSELQSYLRKNLNNSYIILNARLNEEPTPDAGKGRKLYTPEDQFQYLNNKNPSLNILKQQFGLEFE
jgi:DNA polymerase-3 subunit gamma/tau